MTGETTVSGNWSLGKILNHLNRWTSGFLDGGLPHLTGLLQPMARWFMKRMSKTEKYPSFRFPAPKAIVPDNEPLDQAYANFCQMIDRVRGLPPVVKTIPLGDLPLHVFHRMLLLHASHHLGFVRPKD